MYPSRVLHESGKHLEKNQGIYSEHSTTHIERNENQLFWKKKDLTDNVTLFERD